MNIVEARKVIHKFYLPLMGHDSKTFGSYVKAVVISFSDEHLRKSDLKYIDVPGMRLPILQEDGDGFSIFAVLANGDSVNVKTLIESDKIPGFTQEDLLLI